MLKRICYVVVGFIIGLLTAIFFVQPLMAEFGISGSDFSEQEMQPPVPAKYGNLVAISELKMYFQANDGSVYIVKPRSGNQLDSQVIVIKRI